MVEVIGFNLKPELAAYLRSHPPEEMAFMASSRLSFKRQQKQRRKKQLSDQEIVDLLTAFKTGVPKHKLSKRYDVSLWTVKQILREHGVKKRHRYDIKP